MIKPSFNDPKYDKLTTEEKFRQVDRDTMMWEQLQELKKINTNNTNSNYQNPNLEGLESLLGLIIGLVGFIISLIAFLIDIRNSTALMFLCLCSPVPIIIIKTLIDIHKGSKKS